ncbi:MAG: phosphoribosyltransferase [Rubrivivax sp.]|nr:phosphoribosyltransferase [Rubrivivax sp.]
MSLPFADRAQAGRLLADRVAALRLRPPLVVLALPRGGVPVAAEVARVLQAPLDLLLVRKIGAPYNPELAVAAVVDGDPPQTVIDQETLAASGAGPEHVQRELPAALREIARRRHVYMHDRAPRPLQGVTAVVVDDGIATGTTVRAALRGVRLQGAAHVVLAVPVAPAGTVSELADEVDDLVCLAQPSPFGAVGRFYRDFHAVEDDEVLSAMAAAHRPEPSAARSENDA